MAFWQGDHAGLLPKRQAVKRRLIHRPQQQCEIHLAAAQGKQEFIAAPLAKPDLDALVLLHEPHQRLSEPSHRGREICADDQSARRSRSSLPARKRQIAGRRARVLPQQGTRRRRPSVSCPTDAARERYPEPVFKRPNTATDGRNSSAAPRVPPDGCSRCVRPNCQRHHRRSISPRSGSPRFGRCSRRGNWPSLQCRPTPIPVVRGLGARSRRAGPAFSSTMTGACRTQLPACNDKRDDITVPEIIPSRPAARGPRLQAGNPVSIASPQRTSPTLHPRGSAPIPLCRSPSPRRSARVAEGAAGGSRSERPSRIGHSGRPSPWQVFARCRRVSPTACKDLTFCSIVARWPRARRFTSALLRSLSRHRPSSSSISASEKPRSRALRMKRSACTSSGR